MIVCIDSTFGCLNMKKVVGVVWGEGIGGGDWWREEYFNRDCICIFTVSIHIYTQIIGGCQNPWNSMGK